LTITFLSLVGGEAVRASPVKECFPLKISSSSFSLAHIDKAMLAPLFNVSYMRKPSFSFNSFFAFSKS